MSQPSPAMSRSPLRRLLEETAAAEGLPLKDLTVLANQNDPFRVDTPASHRDGEWLASKVQELRLGARTIHLRGLHYMLLGHTKPDGSAYVNADPDWQWLQNEAAKSARWLGYLPFDQIIDQRNSPPIIRVFQQPAPRPYLLADVDIDVPSVEELMPAVGVTGFEGTQTYKLVLFGEKSSLFPNQAPRDCWAPARRGAGIRQADSKTGRRQPGLNKGRRGQAKLTVGDATPIRKCPGLGSCSTR